MAHFGITAAEIPDVAGDGVGAVEAAGLVAAGAGGAGRRIARPVGRGL